MTDIYGISEQRFEELLNWDRAYKGEQILLSKSEILELMAFDAQCLENANYHGECEGLCNLIELVETWQDDEIVNFAYHINDLGAVRNIQMK